MLASTTIIDVVIQPSLYLNGDIGAYSPRRRLGEGRSDTAARVDDWAGRAARDQCNNRIRRL